MDSPAFDLVATHHVLALHIGVAGNLFGGVLLAWVDEAAALFACKAAENRFVTYEMDRVRFLLPCVVGDIVEIRASPMKASRSGLQVEVRVERIGQAGSTETVLSTTSVLVAVDESGKKTGLVFRPGWAERFGVR